MGPGLGITLQSSLADDSDLAEIVRIFQHGAGIKIGAVDGVHTNSIECVWISFKRSLMGSFFGVSAKHIDRYLSELEWPFNNRDKSRIFIDTLKRIVTTSAMPYAELTTDTGAA